MNVPLKGEDSKQYLCVAFQEGAGQQFGLQSDRGPCVPEIRTDNEYKMCLLQR